MKEISKAERLERVFFFFAAALVPCIPLFFLHNKNVAEGIQFSYTIIFGLALAVFSMVLHVILSLAFRSRGAVLIFLTILWAAFWYVNPLHTLLQSIRAELPLLVTISILLFVIAGTVVGLAYIKLPKSVGNAAAFMLCLLFAFNFLPAAYTGIRAQMALAATSAAAAPPYKIKSSFDVDSDLPHPNIYWLHMDGMIGFDSFEQYFGDAQEELKAVLERYGFIINENARMGGAVSNIAMPMMMSPTFFDSWLAPVAEKHADLTCTRRQRQILTDVRNNGFNLVNDILPKTELFKAFSDAGYMIVGAGNSSRLVERAEVTNILNDGKTISTLNPTRFSAETFYANLSLFKDLVVEASALKLFENSINSYINSKAEKVKLVEKEKTPAYESTVERYQIEDSDSSAKMAAQIRATKYSTELKQPHFTYIDNQICHFIWLKSTIGCIFNIDENGNKIDLNKIHNEDPGHDIYNLQRYYVGQYKYSIKQLLAKLEIITENDPDAVIILQGDHGIHGLGPNGGSGYFNEEAFEQQGYNTEDMQNFNKSVISAVRIPPQHGTLAEPLEPLDIARYLVNHYVGEGNYDYLTYQK